MTQLAQRSAEQEKQLATAGEEDLQPVHAGPETRLTKLDSGRGWSSYLWDPDWHPPEET